MPEVVASLVSKPMRRPAMARILPEVISVGRAPLRAPVTAFRREKRCPRRVR